MKYVLEQLRKVEDMYIVGAYDACTLDPSDKTLWRMPFPDVWNLAHSWVFKHNTWGGHRKRHGWIWSQLYGSSILRRFENIEYIFSGNSDCAWDKPEGVNELIDVLGDNDFMSGQSETRHTDGFNFIHTCTMIFKREAYFDFIDYMFEKIPYGGTASYSPESLMQQWVRDNDIKWAHAPKQAMYSRGPFKGHCDTYCEDGGDSTWKDTIGFINIIAEKNWRCTNRKEPLDKKYFDLRDFEYHCTDHDRRCLLPYYKTGDRRYIQLWWDTDIELPRDTRIERSSWTIERYVE
jgi:hypothetical protein